MTTQKTKLDRWLDTRFYLPKPIRDFHHQKDLFKSIHEIYQVDRPDGVPGLNYIMAHMYVIDFFLWFMAKRGYTLQPCKAKQEFLSLEDTLAEQKKIRDKSEIKIFIM